VRRRLLALVVGGTTLALSSAAALAIGYNLDHDHKVENVVALGAHEPGTLVTGWRWLTATRTRRPLVTAADAPVVAEVLVGLW
jgi:hypothetical protein